MTPEHAAELLVYACAIEAFAAVWLWLRLRVAEKCPHECVDCKTTRFEKERAEAARRKEEAHRMAHKGYGAAYCPYCTEKED